MRDIGIGVVSLGWMGRLHASSYQRIPSRFPELGIRPRLVVAADPLEENQVAAREQFGFEKAVASIDEVLADPEVEAVSICSPNFLHRDFALAAAAAGKPFWIEKPMGVDAGQSREIRDAAAGGDKVLRWFSTDLTDDAGEVVARVRKQIYVRRKRDARAQGTAAATASVTTA